MSGGDEKQARWNQRSVTKHPPAPFYNKISTGWNDKGEKKHGHFYRFPSYALFFPPFKYVFNFNYQCDMCKPNVICSKPNVSNLNSPVFYNNHKVGLLQLYWKPEIAKFSI